ncbi:insulinase family protein [Escherichia coli]
MITIPITFCMLIAKYLCLLKPFWLRKNNKTSVLLIIIILAMILGVVKIQVWLNDWNNDFFNALSQKETDKLWQLVLWFPALLGIFVLISVNKTWLIKLLTIRWREWLTDYYLNRWFADKNYYFTQIYGEHKNTDNPDQRIAEDILLLISKTLSLSFGFIQSLSMLITFTVILWQSAGTLSFTVGGTEWNIQGYMVYTVVLIVIGGTFSLNNTPFLSPEETYQLSKRLWQQITVQSLAEKWQQLRKNQDAFWEQMVNNELAAKKALSPAAILALEKEYANKKLAAYIFPGRNLSLTVDADPQAEISSKETLAENLTSLTLSNGARVILAKSAGEEQKLQITAVSNKGDLSFPAQQKSLIALANKAVSGSGVGELSSSSLKRWSAENSVTMSSKVSGMNTLLSVSARTNNPEPGFQLINQRITHSTINDNIWASLQNAQIQALKTLDQRPAEKFAQQMYETRYADDRTKLLQENQIVQFTAADALAADRQLFSSPADITFVIVGNVSEDKLVALITRYLGSIKHSDSPLAAGKPLTRATDNASVTVKEQNEPVAQVSQWKRYDSRTPVNLATRMALDAFNVALAKDLRVNIREQASGAYSVSSRLSVDPQAKDISHLLAFTCQPERHDELLTLANEVMVKRLAKGISEQELNEYQQNVQRSLDIQQRSVQQLANTIVNSLIQYDDPAAWTEQEQLLKQMTVENVNTAVKQYLSHPVNTYTGVLLPK